MGLLSEFPIATGITEDNRLGVSVTLATGLAICFRVFMVRHMGSDFFLVRLATPLGCLSL